MEYLYIEIDNNLDLLPLIQNKGSFFLIHQFNPHQIIEWWETDLNLRNKISVNNVKVRSFSFDILVGYDDLGKILKTNQNQIEIYEFLKTPSDTLTIEDLPKDSKMKILKENGLLNYYFIRFEELTIGSFDTKYILQLKKSISK